MTSSCKEKHQVSCTSAKANARHAPGQSFCNKSAACGHGEWVHISVNMIIMDMIVRTSHVHTCGRGNTPPTHPPRPGISLFPVFTCKRCKSTHIFCPASAPIISTLIADHWRPDHLQSLVFPGDHILHMPLSGKEYKPLISSRQTSPWHPKRWIMHITHLWRKLKKPKKQ